MPGLICTNLILVIIIGSSFAKFSKNIPYALKLARIGHGNVVHPAELPYIVEITGKSGEHLCGGTIIDNEWILTAAHCLEDVQTITIGYGATNRLKPIEIVTVQSDAFYMAYDYNRSLYQHDIALIRTPYMPFTSLIKKIALPSKTRQSKSLFAHTWALASGWGMTKHMKISDDLISAKFKIIDNSECEKFYLPGVITHSILCVNTFDSAAICAGDDGGPLVLEDQQILVGIFSFYPVDSRLADTLESIKDISCLFGKPAAFTRVTEYLNWIENVSGVSY